MANLTMRVGSCFYRAVVARNGRIKPGWAWVDGRQEHHPDSVYYLDWYEGGKRKRRSVGRDALNAQNLAHQRATSRQPATPLAAAVASYLEEIRLTKKPRTHLMYAKGLEYFRASCQKTNVIDVDRSDLLAFIVYLRDTVELSPRTVHNHFANLVSFLKSAGRERIARKGDWPDYVEEEPEIYEPEELARLFDACTPSERTLYQFFLYSGFREQEVMYVAWRDIGPSTATVRHKPQYSWSPKAYKERTSPLPATFAAQLLSSKGHGDKLIFATPQGAPDGHMLRRLKLIVARAGMNPADWWLHKFRATFATRHLRSGSDLRTVQHWLGHSDIASTMRYLRAAEGAGVQERVEAAWES